MIWCVIPLRLVVCSFCPFNVIVSFKFLRAGIDRRVAMEIAGVARGAEHWRHAIDIEVLYYDVSRL